MDEWYIGDSVGWGDGFMDAQNWGRSYGDEKDSNESSSQYSKRDEYSKKAGDYFMDNKFDYALHYINMYSIS